MAYGKIAPYRKSYGKKVTVKKVTVKPKAKPKSKGR